MSITPALPTSSFDRCVHRTAPAALAPTLALVGSLTALPAQAADTEPRYSVGGDWNLREDGAWGETVTVSDEVVFTTTEGFDVEFAYTPATGALTVTPSGPVPTTRATTRCSGSTRTRSRSRRISR